ncbi:MAG: hypothetical protein KIT02_15800 [Devosia sp.]|uniref:hypothetical protein n=1 Tax=Devosia sp. TaxID=1871048 RepID=UPI0024CA73AF|nr:hypothetical protein [Devosia sp.]UYN99356.1 MAG: hypothetical protein KIT02_15800 [Devosia sp.]
MKLWAELREAGLGWLALLRGEASWLGHFAPTLGGLVRALAIYLLLAFLVVTLAAMSVGVPTVWGFAASMIVLSLAVLALLVSDWLTRRIVPTTEPPLRLLVPGIYALCAYLIAGGLVSLISGALLPLLWLALAVLLYFLGRRAAHWSHGVAAGFAVLTVVLLVGTPVTIYMLLGLPAAAIS